MSDETQNTNTDELRESIRAEVKAELDRQDETIRSLVADEIAAAPEHIKKLMPDALAPVEQVKWLRKAKDAGLFTAPTVATTDTRRPANTKPAVDTATLSPIARIAAGYTNTK